MFLGILTVGALLCHLSLALDNGLALTPPMGWLSWERFRCNINCDKDPDHCISEKLYMRQADMIVSEGYKDAGYQYVNVDDCWPAMQRDKDGNLVADPKRFPSGIKALSKYMHSKGLKLGIYEDFGIYTCDRHFPGSEFNMERDANTFAEWEVDSLKFDGCNSNPSDMPTGYPLMATFLNKTGRPIMYSCEWPFYMWKHSMAVSDYKTIAKSCNIWRNYEDIQDSWDSILGIIDFWGKNEGNFSEVAGPGSFNDPDMLLLGDYGLSYFQQKAQIGLWALWAAPLMMSNDLMTVSNESKALLQNKNIIAINQDPLGNQAVRVYNNPKDISVWVKKLSKKGSRAIGFLNVNYKGMPVTYTTSFADIGLTNSKGYAVREAFENKTIGNFKLNEKFDTYVDPTSIYIMIADPL